MTFRRIETNSHYRSLRLGSETGAWDLGLSPYQWGCRLRMGPSGRPPSVLDLCLGPRPDLWGRVLVAVVKILDDCPEHLSSSEIDARFPWAGTRPDLRQHLEMLECPPVPP